VKTFEKFLVESSKPIKQLGDNIGKVDTKRGPGNILSDIEQKQFVKNERSKKQVLRNLEQKNKVKKNVIPDSKPPVTRFDPTEPFMDDDLGQRTGKTGDKVVNKPVTQTSKVVLGPDGKPLAYKGKNIPVSKPTAGETMIKGIKDADLEKKALDQTRKDLLNPKVDTKPVTTTKNVVKKRGPSKGYLELQKKARGVLKDLKKEKAKEDALAKQKTTIRPKIEKKFTTTQPSSATQNIGKNVTSQTRSPKVITKSFSDLGKKSQKKISKSSVTTNISKPVKFKSFLDRMGQATGIKNPIRKTLAKTDKVTGLSGKDLKNLKGKVRAGGILKGVGRFAGGVFAVKDAYDKARKEKAKGRSKTSQILGGIAKGAGGYIGGAIGATAGTLAGGGVGSFALGTGGAIAGYNLGSKAGEYLYKKGRQYATGEKKINFKKFMKNIRK
jgi:hypothetical protein